MNSTPVNIGIKPTGISPSRVNQIETCPKQYQYVSIEKLHESKKMATYRGTFFHEVMEKAFLRTMDDPTQRSPELALEIMREIVPVSLSEEIAQEMGLDGRGVQEFLADVSKYIRNYFLMEDPMSIVSEGIEVRYDLDMGGFGLRGILDRLDRDPDGSLVIADYKTGKVPSGRYKDSALLPAKIYAYLCQEVLGERPKTIRLYYVQFGKTIEIRVTDDDVAYAEQRVRQAWAKIEGWWADQYFPATPNNLCNGWCSFKNICPAWNREEDFPF
jgi:putative RecB family exonuclease